MTVARDERARQRPDIGDREIHPLRARRRHNVRGVAREEQPAVLHRLRHEAAHRRHALLRDAAWGRRPAAVVFEARAQFLPDARIRPFGQVLVGPALQVQSGDGRRAHREQREAARVMRIDELVERRRRIGEDAEPGVRVHALERAPPLGGDRLARDAVKAVAAGDIVAIDPIRATVRVHERHRRPLGRDVVQRDVAHVEVDRLAVLERGRDQVAHDFVLAVDGDRAAGRQLAEIDPVAAAVEQQLDAAMHEPFAPHPRAEARIVQRVDGALLQHAGADPVLAVFA
ncbi:4-hydroxybenzoate 3-monooxygenase domain protein [Burkholderia pseudomallei]|nr:4-hydroxybenzoate 3-monooxygenase domain protein [Burkholderia pseudomallei]